MSKNRILVISLVVVLIAGGVTVFLLTRSDGMPDRGETFLAVERTLGLDDEVNPVREDLVQRGLVDVEGPQGHLDVGGIDMMIGKGIYEIDDEGYLVFGPDWTLMGEYPLEITWQDAEIIIGSPLLGIGYLPVNCSIHGLYIEEKKDQFAHFTVVITDSDFFAGDELNEDDMDNKILVEMNLYKQGQIGGLKLPGDWYDIGVTGGLLLEFRNELLWLFPYAASSGTYEMHILADNDMPVDEMLKIARSIG